MLQLVRTQTAKERKAARSPRALQRRQEIVEAWERAIGESRVNSSSSSLEASGSTCIGVQRLLLAILRPETEAHVQALIKVAAEYAVPLYPVSTGRNWGYGSAAPITDDCALVDLSMMRAIVEVDADLGTVRVQPGVTQQQLYDYLAKNDLPFIVPVTGAGPSRHLPLAGDADPLRVPPDQRRL